MVVEAIRRDLSVTLGVTQSNAPSWSQKPGELRFGSEWEWNAHWTVAERGHEWLFEGVTAYYSNEHFYRPDFDGITNWPEASRIPTALESSGPWLVPIDGLGGTKAVRDILSNRALIESFASLESKEDIRKFANEWGLLGHGFIVSSAPEGKYHLAGAEPLAEWQLQIFKIRACREIWQGASAAKSGNPVARARLSDWFEDKGSVGLQFKKERAVEAGISPNLFAYSHAPQVKAQGTLRPSTWPRITYRQDIAEVGRYFVQQVLNEGLSRWVDVVTSFDAGPRYFLVPRNLIGCIYKQLGDEVLGISRKPTMCCEVCHSIFQPKRSDAKTCTDRCRQIKNRRMRQSRETQKKCAAHKAP
jgi:hypothetical protein